MREGSGTSAPGLEILKSKGAVSEADEEGPFSGARRRVHAGGAGSSSHDHRG